MYYVHDLYHLKRIQERLKFIAEEMVNILQNISQTRANKAITNSDIKYASAAAYLSFFPGKTFYNTSENTSPLGYSSSGQLYCVKGQAGGKASTLWSRRFTSSMTTFSPSSVTIQKERDGRSVINAGTDITASAIHKDLKIAEGEIKILLEVGIHCAYGDRDYKFPNGKTIAEAGGLAKVLGFYVYPFKSNTEHVMLHEVVIFTPKPGTFDPNKPPE